MARVCDHLSVEELEERYVGCQDATASRHFQVGARPHRFASFGNDSIWRAMDRTIACLLQRGGS